MKERGLHGLAPPAENAPRSVHRAGGAANGITRLDRSTRQLGLRSVLFGNGVHGRDDGITQAGLAVAIHLPVLMAQHVRHVAVLVVAALPDLHNRTLVRSHPHLQVEGAGGTLAGAAGAAVSG